MSFEEKIKEWLEIDDKLKKLNEDIKVLRNKKNNITEKINVVIENNKLQEALVEIPGGKLKFTQSKNYQPITLTYINTCLSNIIQDEEQVKQIMEYIKRRRDVKFSSDIKRYYSD